jgi:hypothetical protein
VTAGSIQLRQYLAARRDGVSQFDAAALTDMPIAEARLWDADETKGLLGWVGPVPEITPKEEAMPKHDLIEEAPEANDPLIDLTAETLRGDIRDSLLGWFKAAPKAWPCMSEREQRDLADAADRYAYAVIKQAAEIIAAGERPCIVAKLVEYKEKDGVEAKLKLASTGEVVGALHEACGKDVLIVTSGADEFLGQAGDAQIDADAPKFPNIGDEYDQAA